MIEILKNIEIAFVPTLIGLVFLMFFFLKRKKDYIQNQSSIEKITSFIQKKKVLNKVSHYIQMRLNIEDKEKREKITIMIIMSYFFYVIFISYVIIDTFPVWYLSVVCIVIALVSPFIVLNYMNTKKRLNAIKQLPAALDELAMAFNNKPTLIENLYTSSESMPKEIGQEFRRLAQLLKTTNTEEAISQFVERNDSEWTKILAVILKNYIKRGGNISGQLDYLNDNMSYYFLFKTKVKNAMLFPKLVLVLLFFSTLYTMHIMQNMMPIIKIILNTDIVAMTMVIMFVVAIVLGFITLSLLERI